MALLQSVALHGVGQGREYLLEGLAYEFMHEYVHTNHGFDPMLC